MLSLAAQTIFTPEEYLALERKGAVKNEHLHGERLGIFGANFAHTFIIGDIVPELDIQLNCKRLGLDA